ncbi:MAG: hypothetical protein KJN97_00745, partial [Deltaproteobacteria bacterium]|nr:hypothetical protein [Deltaproteobacteria bacterium]
DWRARRGEACLVPAPKPNRPDLQAEPFDAGPRRAFFPRPGTLPLSLALPLSLVQTPPNV